MSMTRQEVFQALADGKEIERRPVYSTYEYTSIVEGDLFCNLNPRQFDEYEWRIKTEPKWYENIPEHGVLVRRGQKMEIGLIVDYDAGTTHPFQDDKGMWWSVVYPMTNDEIKQFLREE